MQHLFTILQGHTWLGIDKLATYTAASSNGSIACRLLLKSMQQALGIVGELIDSHIPYQLVLPDDTYLSVSFSHSREHVAVLLSYADKIGVDIEDRTVKEKVAKRYFSATENQWLTTLSDRQQQQARQLLWTLKESLIKQNSAKDSMLFKRLNDSVLEYLTIEQLQSLLQTPIIDKNLSFIQNSNQCYGYIAHLNCAFIVQNSD